MAEYGIADIKGVLDSQRAFFRSQATKDLGFRLESLKKLKRAILDREEEINQALAADLHKSPFEAYATEIGFVLEEISYHIRHLRKWAKPTRVATDLVNIPSRSSIIHEPYGLVLIMAPWNYPFQLLMDPLVGAISAGNCVVLKPAHYSTRTTEVISRLIRDTFPPEYINVFSGGRETNQALLEERYDYILFTGSPSLGKLVMERAARYLTPVSLELGGKSPCIVDEDAKLDVAARRAVFGKLLNAGQTCIAPDYFLVHQAVKEAFVQKVKECIRRSYGDDPRKSPDYGRIINRAQFDKLTNLIASGKVIHGGKSDPSELYIEPTILDGVLPEDPVMADEIFGPIIPILTIKDMEEAVSLINSREKPLALYYFGSRRKKADWILSRTSSGGACVNDTVVHLTNPLMPFGGVGNSGMGAYHGKWSFDCFSHHRSVLSKATWLDIRLRYPPYGKKLGLVKRILK